MKVMVAEKCGFCPGVRNAISTAEKVLARHGDQGPVYSLGPIIHNPNEVQRLARAGLHTVESVDQIPSGTVLIRSHGAAPDQIEHLQAKGVTIIDATCVLVKRLQKIARQMEDEGYQVVIIGEANHPEVQAVKGHLRDAVVITGREDLSKIPSGGRLGIVCQTTQSPEQFGAMLGAIAEGHFLELKVINTLCRESCKRQDSAVRLCRRVDVMFVLGGLHSANTRRLAELCRKVNPNTYHLEVWRDLDQRVLAGHHTAGVTAGASTPDWVIEEFVKNLEAIEP
jgi:(E)-4-hydroxy-3-methyl-but-2-enyl pyrophosphate reductase